MCADKEDSLIQVFAAILKKLSAQGANKVNHGISCDSYDYPNVLKYWDT